MNEIMELITITNPNKMLDVGVGFGKYGFLSREYLELWDGRQKYNDWKKQIDGIEVFKDYITPLHHYIYNKIYIGNVIDILPEIETDYDLVLLIDVFEHFGYQDGMKLLEECFKHGKNVLVSIPKDIGTQGETFGNPFEAHKFQWKKKHFEKYPRRIFISNQYSLICYIGDRSSDLEKAIIKLKYDLIKWKIDLIVRKHFPFISYIHKFLKKCTKNITGSRAKGRGH